MRKKLILAALLSPALSGCAMLQQKQPSEAVPQPLKVSAVLPVQPAEVTVSNAKAKLQQLQDEMDRDAEAFDGGIR